MTDVVVAVVLAVYRRFSPKIFSTILLLYTSVKNGSVSVFYRTVAHAVVCVCFSVPQYNILFVSLFVVLSVFDMVLLL